MLDKKKQALEMFMSGTATQTHIAAQVGVSERTLYSWIKDNGWDRLRQASLAAPIMIADELCTQLINLQRSIATREEGQQFPTLQEANITGKLIMSLGRLKNFPSISQSLQVLQAFRHYVHHRNKDAAWQIGHFMESFLEDRAKFGFVPSQPEYGINPVNPFGTEDTPAKITYQHTTPPEGGRACTQAGMEGLDMNVQPTVSVSASRTLLRSFGPGTSTEPEVVTENSDSEMQASDSAQITENKEVAEDDSSFRHQQKPAISGNQQPHSPTAPDLTLPLGEGIACLPGSQNSTNHEAPLNSIAQPCITGNSIPETIIAKPAQVTENNEVTQETTHMRHQQEPAISGSNPNPQFPISNSKPPSPNPLTITVNWEDGPNALPLSVIFTLPDGKKEEVPFAGLVEAQVKRSIGNRELTPELYEAHRKAAEMTLATNFMDKRYGHQDRYRKAS